MGKVQQGFRELRVRSLAEERSGFSTSHTQFHRFVKSGLLEEGRDGLYPPENIDHLIEAHQLGKEVRSIARRVVRARKHRKIAAGKVRTAIIDVISEMKRPQRNLRKMAMAVKQVTGQDDVIFERTRKLRKDRWKRLVDDVGPDELDDALDRVYYFLVMMNANPTLTAPSLLEDVPLEERLILLLVLDLAGRE